MKHARPASPFRPRAIGCAVSAALFALFCSSPARADCSPAVPLDGQTVTCSGPTVLGNPFVSNANNLTINVDPRAQVAPLVGVVSDSMRLGGTGVVLNNSGSIDSSLLGQINGFSAGVRIDNVTAKNFVINNSATGLIAGAGSLLGPNGAGIYIQNGAGGLTTIVNNGSIEARQAQGVAVVPADLIAIAAESGGALGVGGRVNITNNGTIRGRIGLANGGNSFTNAGTIRPGRFRAASLWAQAMTPFTR